MSQRILMHCAASTAGRCVRAAAMVFLLAMLMTACLDGSLEQGGPEPAESTTVSNLHVGDSVITVKVQEGDTTYVIDMSTALTSIASCVIMPYRWTLVSPSGRIHLADTTDGKLHYQLSKNSLSSGEYWIELSTPFCGPTRSSNGFLLPVLFSTFDVGVISATGSCSRPPSANVPAIDIFMDNEDSRAASTTNGWVGATLVDGNKNTHFYFCRTNGTSFGSLTSSNSASNNYAVLKLGTTCPPGSVPFSRRFDNEDHNNLNDFTGSTGVSNLQIAPNMSFRSPSETTLVFCLFKGDGPLVAKLPALPFSYGVFAAQSFQWTSAHGSIFTDDEDDNANGYDVDPSWQTAAQQIIVPGGNTILNTARALECGDHLCSAGENIDNCFADCDVCGNGTCRANEDFFNCPQDCAGCGDGICSSGEDSSWCSDCMPCPEGSICQT